jgi:hypothetical protein
MVSIFFPFRFPYPTYGIGNCKQKKLEEKIIFLWHEICCCQFGIDFGMRFALPAILADRRPRLPFWQLVCHFVIWHKFCYCHYGGRRTVSFGWYNPLL